MTTLVKTMGVGRNTFYYQIDKDSPDQDFINKFNVATGDDFLSIVSTGVEPAKVSKSDTNAMLIGEAPDQWETEEIPLGNNKYGLTMPLVPVRAYGGLLDNYGDPEFYQTLEKHTITTAGNQHGSYLAFVVKGNSMENWSSEEMAKMSIPENWIVTARNLPRHHWKNKLHLHRWEIYVFVHKDGIIIKQVTEHNTSEGWVIAHSLNPDYEDRKIFFEDCYQVLNVVHKGVSL